MTSRAEHILLELQNCKRSEPEPEPCFLCGGRTTKGDYCWGCKKFVCETCSQNPSLGPGHAPEDHLDGES